MRSTYEAKKVLRDLGMPYEHIDAYKNDCMLFWKATAGLDKCSERIESRYKTNHRRGKKIAHKVLHYFSLTLRLQKLYISKERASDMRWHKDKHVDDGILRHLVDSVDWKEQDLHYPQLSQDPCNARLRLASDSFNPFRNMSTL